eukprot:CAMPEP_0204901898 /NCGR_PEP_ID=MMETSP1397-20131031/3348_1 /ASSEMBLY_ACC=CAM_ASM_000891 /TAXON_ID=49980 /ORGANISM="Climacostomum Climacostomum virens, Strain Stock W-24" /LENGTH=1637 /DNA_ID=CAMNT_0052070321 /DNA_START=1200 /DNA_END=6113 /DNA_ORIENTATION=-
MMQIVIKSVDFTYNNVVVPASSSSIGSLINLTNVRELQILSCNFKYNLVGNSGTFYLTLSRNWPVTDSGGVSLEHSLTHIYLKDTNVTNNTASGQAILYINARNEFPNVKIENCQFRKNLSLKTVGAIVVIGNLAALTRAFDTTTSSGIRILASWFEITSSKFEDNVSSTAGLFTSSRIPNLTMTDVKFIKNGFPYTGTFSLNSYTISFWKDNPDIYLMSDITTLALVVCSNMGTIGSGVNVSITGGSYILNNCSSASSSALFINAATNISISNFLIRSNHRDAGATGRSFVLGAANVQVNGLTVANSTNLDTSRGVIEFGRKDATTSSSIVVKNSTFDSNYAETTGIVYLNSLASAKFEACTFKNNTSNNIGVAIYSKPQSKLDFGLNILSSKFYDNTSKGFGAIYVEKVDMTVDFQIDSCEFLRNKASEGSAIYLDAVITPTSKLVNSIFQANTSTSLATIYLKPSTGIFSIQNCKFQNNSAPLTAVIEATYSSGILEVLRSYFEGNSGEEILHLSQSASSQKLTLSNNNFNGNKGISLSCEFCDLSDSDSTYEGNFDTAVYLTSASSALFNRVKLSKNTQAEIGGAVVLTISSSLMCKACDFLDNSSTDKAGAVYVERKSVFQAENSTFMRNTSNLGSVMYLMSTKQETSILKSCIVTENSSTSYGSIYLSESSLTFDSSSMYSNYEVGGMSPGFNLFKANLSLQNSELRDQSSTKGSFVSASFNSSIIINNSSILRGNSSSIGGAIFAEYSALEITNSNFKESISTYGGGLYLDYCNTLIKNSTFALNRGTTTSGDLSIQSGQIEVYSSIFNSSRRGAIKISALNYAKFSNVTMTGGITFTRFIATDVKLLEIENSYFLDNNSSQGGGLIASGASTVVLTNNTFFNNTACSGGAVYLDGVNSTFVNNTFIFNRATCKPNSGGAVKLVCDVDCKNNFTSNDFQNNSAVIGGALHWTTIVPTLQSNNFKKNSAVYGNDFASYTSAVVMVDLNKNNKEGFNLSEVIVSGQLVTAGLVYNLVDPQGQVVASDNSSACELAAEGADLTGAYRTTAKKGELTFQSFTLTGIPGTTLSLTVWCQDPAIAHLKEEFFLRSCMIGEYQAQNDCYICPPDSYSFDPLTPCKECSSNAKCFGNYTVVPKEGYWRLDFLSENFYECPRKASCLGPEDSDYSLTGKCEEGYHGVKCSGCVQGYSMTGRYECSECIQNTKTYVMRAFMCLLVAVFAVGSVWLSLRAATRNRSLMSVYLKILMNYFQITSVTTYFKLNWPSLFVQLISANMTLSDASDKTFTASCIFPELNSKETFYLNISVIAVLPFCLICATIVVWVLIRLQSVPVDHWRDKLVGSMTVLIFLIHPFLTKQMFSIFACEKVESDSWISSDFSIMCWDYEHYFYVLAFAMPSLIIWVCFLPIFCVFFLFKKRMKLEDASSKYILGFLYHGYRPEVFYWEFVVLYRKIGIIVVAVFMNTYETNQAVTAVILLFFFYVLQIRVKPYSNAKLNTTEELSIVVSTTTISCGLYFLTNETGEVGTLFLFTIVTLTNTTFFLFWLKEASTLAAEVVSNKFPRLVKSPLCSRLIMCCTWDCLNFGRHRKYEGVVPMSPQDCSAVHKAPANSFDVSTILLKGNEDVTEALKEAKE